MAVERCSLHTNQRNRHLTIKPRREREEEREIEREREKEREINRERDREKEQKKILGWKGDEDFILK